MRPSRYVYVNVHNSIYLSMHFSVGLTKTGGLSIWMQFTILLLCVVSTFYGDAQEGSCVAPVEHTGSECTSIRNKEIGLLLAGVVVSRMGLWMFDLSVSQMLQERINLNILGAVNGTQSSMQELMDLFGYVLGLLLNKPTQFKYLVYISMFFVATAAGIYTSFWSSDDYDDHTSSQKQQLVLVKTVFVDCYTYM